MAARIYQAKAIIGIDIHKQRLEVARNLGATHTLDASGDALTDASGDALTDQFRALCGDQGLMFAVDTTGIPAVIETMIASLGIRGRAVTIGAPKLGSTVKVDVLSHLVMGRVYMGSSQGDSNPTEMIPRLIEHHLAGRLPIEQFVTTYNAENFKEAIEDMRSGKVIKPVLLWRKTG
ncbi:uncharacterized protein HMPREF1541_02924 [Cyphellophora europaea CBS 101466]|uniref:Alcohol dehydrogenase-like C-terminal domain-containing protein n=1 Tax=Cyphellophora europaea (strain CBS 101466) TaxID=1220924 RepID=W2RX36_CYPE1|nr:uncharacterized protein HMPREF1541_02924 [Cyphellophora europaea CBS 101466]ETN40992.1 hypothetical protein HMPREF1541_02924 [Cyphellophora europaea CBS 101466]